MLNEKIKKVLNSMKGNNDFENFVINDIIDNIDNYENGLNYLEEVLQHGCISGVVSSLITYEDTKDVFKKYFEEIVEISRQEIPYDLMVNKITINLMHIFMYVRNRVLTENADLPDIIRKKLDECVESYFNLDKLCENMNYSKNYIINVFKNKYKITPYQYYLDKKIDAAKTYLTHTNVSIGTISKTLHYADQQYFSSSLKKAVGCSPLEYRRKTRKE